MMSNNADTGGVQAVLNILGGKWKLLILWHLRDGSRRYGELKRLMPGITEKMLIQQLRELEQDGLVTRTAYPEIPPHVEYDFSACGRSLRPVLQVLCHWGNEYLTQRQKQTSTSGVLSNNEE
jgi:DNA-binding HxlR family transcriptional regulator